MRARNHSHDRSSNTPEDRSMPMSWKSAVIASQWVRISRHVLPLPLSGYSYHSLKPVSGL